MGLALSTAVINFVFVIVIATEEGVLHVSELTKAFKARHVEAVVAAVDITLVV